MPSEKNNKQRVSRGLRACPEAIARNLASQGRRDDSAISSQDSCHLESQPERLFMSVTPIADSASFPGDPSRIEEMACLRKTLVRDGNQDQLVDQCAVLLEVSRVISSTLSLDILLPDLRF